MIVQNQLSGNVLTMFEEELQEEILNCRIQHFDKGAIVVRQEGYVKSFPFILKGSIRVYRRGELRELLLYHVNPGEICTMSMAACLKQEPFYVEMSAMTDCEVVSIPAMKVLDWQSRYHSWNTFVVKAFSARHQQLFQSLDAIVFETIDQRIKNYLYSLSAASRNPVIPITHQELANELGTTRVVISRILKSLEMEGVVDLLRGAIRVRNMKVSSR